MRISSVSVLCSVLTAATLWCASGALADSRWYADDYYDYYDYPPDAYPPPPPVRIYREPPPPPPPVVYEPPVYGWVYVPPPRPASCGKYRYWDGERCADARYDPPYVGPRW